MAKYDEKYDEIICFRDIFGSAENLSDNGASSDENDEKSAFNAIEKNLSESIIQLENKESDFFIEDEKILSLPKTKAIYFYLRQVINDENIAIDVKNILFQIIIHQLLYDILLTPTEIDIVAEKCNYVCSIFYPNQLVETYNQVYNVLLNDLRIDKLQDNDLKYFLMSWLNDPECVSSDERIDFTNVLSQIIVHKLLYEEIISPTELDEISENSEYRNIYYQASFDQQTYNNIYNLYVADQEDLSSLLIKLSSESANID